MNWLERYFLRRICRKTVLQGKHDKRIIEYYNYLNKAAQKEFTEDNIHTLNSFLKECFDTSLVLSVIESK